MAEQAKPNALVANLSKLQPNAHWFLRIGMASIFLYHAYDKMSNGTPPQDALDFMFYGSSMLFWAVAIGELLAGAGIILGAGKFAQADLVTRISGLIFAVIMLGAFIFHFKNGANPWHFFGAPGGGEFQFFLMLTGLFFAARGNNTA